LPPIWPTLIRIGFPAIKSPGTHENGVCAGDKNELSRPEQMPEEPLPGGLTVMTSFALAALPTGPDVTASDIEQVGQIIRRGLIRTEDLRQQRDRK